jgi:hypothetical protein
MSTTFNEDVTVRAALTVSGQFTGADRTSLETETGIAFPIPLTSFRIWDDFGEPLKSPTQHDFAVSFAWNSSSADASFFTASREYRVVGIRARIEVAGTDGSAVTATLRKAASGTDIASGTALHSGTIDLKGTVDTNPSITLSTTSTDLDIASGTSIGIDFTGTLTDAAGTVTVYLQKVSTDDLHIKSGAFGTGCPYIVSRDLNAITSNTAYARASFKMPECYVPGSPVTFRFASGMLTSAASSSAYIDVQCYVSNRDTLKTGSDLVTTAQQSINSTSFADKDFSVTGSSLEVGSVLDILVALISTTATASSHFAAIADAEVILHVRG